VTQFYGPAWRPRCGWDCAVSKASADDGFMIPYGHSQPISIVREQKRPLWIMVIVIGAAICNNEVTICQVDMSERPSARTIGPTRSAWWMMRQRFVVVCDSRNIFIFIYNKWLSLYKKKLYYYYGTCSQGNEWNFSFSYIFLLVFSLEDPEQCLGGKEFMSHVKYWTHRKESHQWILRHFFSRQDLWKEAT
jgi:hypothetical protein